MRPRSMLHTSALVLAIVGPGANAQVQGSSRPPAPTPPANATPMTPTPAAEAKIAALRALRETDPGTTQRGFGDQVLVAAKTTIKRNDLSAAEAILGLANPYETGTSYWSLHTGGALVSIALELSRENDRVRTGSVVTRALQHLEQATELARQSGDARGQVAAKTTAAFLHERFRGDPAAAISSYRAALQADPADKAAKEALERLERSLATLRARVESRGH